MENLTNQDELFDVKGYLTRVINEKQAIELQGLLEKCSDYCLLVDGYAPRPSAASDMITERPEGKAVEDKLLVGIYSQEKEMIGVLDAIRNYPRADDWWIGLMLIDPIHRNQGLGKKVIQSFKDWAKQRGVKWIFLGVVEVNEKARIFWQSVGFKEIMRQPPREFGILRHVVISMRHEL